MLDGPLTSRTAKSACGRAAVLPRVRDDRGDELRDRQAARDHHHAAVCARRRDEAIDKTQPTLLPGVPTLFNAIVNHPKLKTFDLTSLKFCLSGGAPLPIEMKKKFEALTGCKLVEGYGLSEASPVAAATRRGPAKPGCIGHAAAGTGRLTARPGRSRQGGALGRAGEFCVHGPQVMKGYWKRPDETAEQFVGATSARATSAVMDAEGSFFIVDRIKDMIIARATTFIRGGSRRRSMSIRRSRKSP